MHIYQPHMAINEHELVAIDNEEAKLGGRIIDGDPQIAVRIDYHDDGMAAGIFEATTGRVEIDFPFTELATILEGEVTITDEAGRSHTYRPGDTYLIRQGEIVIWEVKGERVRKAFFNIRS